MGGHQRTGIPGPVELFRAASGLPVAERAHLSGRLSSAPWARVVAAFRMNGTSLLDVGCGPGLLAHLLERAGYAGSYLGVDPDERKVDRARTWLAESPRREFRVAGVEGVPERGFDQVAIVDVLYLVPPSERAALVAAISSRLAPGGRLVALTSGGGPGWKRVVDRVQERLAVAVLGFTHGVIVAPCDGAEVAELLSRAGLLDVRVEDAGEGYLHGFELVSGLAPGSGPGS